MTSEDIIIDEIKRSLAPYRVEAEFYDYNDKFRLKVLDRQGAILLELTGLDANRLRKKREHILLSKEVQQELERIRQETVEDRGGRRRNLPPDQ